MASKAPTKTTAAKTSAAPAPAAKTPRKPRTPTLSLAQRFDLMQFVKSSDAGSPDAAVASAATQAFGRAISKATVTSYRKEFGIASVAQPKVADLLAQIAVLKEENARLLMKVAEAPHVGNDTAP